MSSPENLNSNSKHANPSVERRVLVVGSYAYPDSFEWHVTDSLRQLGCAVDLFHSRGGVPGAFDWAHRAVRLSQMLLREPELLVARPLINAVAKFSPTMILVLLGNQLSPKTVAAVRKVTQAPIVCWCQDHLGTLGRQFLVGSGYDAVFVKDRYMQDLFSRMIRSTAFYYLPEACNPRVHRPIALSQADRDRFGCDVMLAGSLYYYRQEILRQLQGIDLRVWGYRPSWLVDRLPGRFSPGLIHGDDKVRASLAATVCLNTLQYAEVNGLNCRAFEIPGCGGFQLVTDVPVLAEHFEPGVEVATFRSASELREKVVYYAKNPEIARAIADKGLARAHRDHTYERRLTDMLRIASP
jgi:spore maturation protein CgeB